MVNVRTTQYSSSESVFPHPWTYICVCVLVCLYLTWLVSVCYPKFIVKGPPCAVKESILQLSCCPGPQLCRDWVGGRTPPLGIQVSLHCSDAATTKAPICSLCFCFINYTDKKTNIQTQGTHTGAPWQLRGGGGKLKKAGTYVYLRLIHVDAWQKTTQYCSYPSIKNKQTNKKAYELLGKHRVPLFYESPFENIPAQQLTRP